MPSSKKKKKVKKSTHSTKSSVSVSSTSSSVSPQKNSSSHQSQEKQQIQSSTSVKISIPKSLINSTISDLDEHGIDEARWSLNLSHSACSVELAQPRLMEMTHYADIAQNQLNQVEEEISTLESSLLEDTGDYGNVVTGYDDLTKNSNKLVNLFQGDSLEPHIIKPEERIFSMSSFSPKLKSAKSKKPIFS